MVASATTIEYRICYNQVSSGHAAITTLKLIKFQVCPCRQPSGHGPPVANTKPFPCASKMSSARRRESSADDDPSVAEAGPAMESGSGDDDHSPSQYRKARLMEDSGSGVEDSDLASDNPVESEGSVASSDGRIFGYSVKLDVIF